VWVNFLPVGGRISVYTRVESARRREEDARLGRAKSTFSPDRPGGSLHDVPDQREEIGLSASLQELRSDQAIDQTFQNLLRALTLSLELRARYRVFEFEATQDGHPDTALLFKKLRLGQGEQVHDLIVGLQTRIGRLELAAPEGGMPPKPTEVAT
jgi:hypothetical protein